ncbi:MAG: sigma 54-interacting transcriptional regulator [Desulfobacterales bacterium]|nr:sigma 54-interacting transcriptional regulator [Desulfobacterales bacterium]
MEDRKFKFALVGHSRALADAVRAGMDPDREELICKVVKMGEAIPTAQALFDQGVEAVFGHMGNSRLMRRATGRPIVHIPRTRLDLIIAFKKARAFGSTVALSSFSRPTEGIDLIQELLDIRIHPLVFNTVDELKAGVHRAWDQGVRVLVGGGISTTIMEELGGTGVLSLPRPHVIDQAFAEARMIASVNRREQAQNQRLEAVLQLVDQGIIGTDPHGRLNLFNRAAGDILGIPDLGKHPSAFQKILRETRLMDALSRGESEKDKVCQVNGVNVVASSLPIRIHGRSQGAITLFRGARRIENINRKVKESLYAKGFTVKYQISDILGNSPGINRALEKARRFAPTRGNVLIQGETGTGKEMFAQAIHGLSRRAAQPFVAINCGAIPESLMESELFGHEEGAFTGARRGGKIGLIELADGGTLFLDEIADVPPSLQVRLLRVIENKEVMRVGGDRYVPVDIRVITSSYKDLAHESRRGNFRPDLYYRLATLKLTIPPLGERTADIPALLNPLLEHHGKSPLTPGMVQILSAMAWPGNVRELLSLGESYCILLGEEGENLDIFMELAGEMGGQGAPPLPPTLDPETLPHPGADLKARLAPLEQQIISQTLEACQFNRAETARKLGISVNTLWRKLKGGSGDPEQVKISMHSGSKK